MESVRDQTVPVQTHVVIADDGSLGTERKYNRAFLAATTTWVAFLDDDNWWFHAHVETIVPYFDEADVIYTWDAGKTRPREDISHLSSEKQAILLTGTNVIDQSCAVRSEMFERAGRFQSQPDRPMDQDLWLRIARAGGRFLAIPKETWFYTAR